MGKEDVEHSRRHASLHALLLELVADFITSNLAGNNPSTFLAETSVKELIKWSGKQTSVRHLADVQRKQGDAAWHLHTYIIESLKGD